MAHQLNNVENKCLLCLPSKTLMMIIIMTLSSKSLWLYLAIFILQSSSTIVNGYLFSTNSGQSLSLSSSSSSSSSRSSVHRFSNLYGTIIHCQDYLQPITTTKSSSSSSTLTTNSINHHMSHLLPRPSSSTTKSSLLMIDNGLEHDLQSMLDLAYQQYSNNISFEWQVGFQQQSSQQSSSSSLQYQKAIDLAQLRSTNPKDGTLALSPFGLDSFIPDVHDAYYRCLLHMPNGYGIITSRELHLQAVVERFTTNRASTIKSSTNTINMDHHTSAKQRLTHEQTLSMDDQMIRVRVLNSSEVYEGNDAILKCEFNRYNSLYEVAAWFRDDGKIYLPLERLVSSIRRTLSGGLSTSSSTSSSSSSSSSSLSSNTVHYVNFSTIRHFVLPGSGDLLISSVSYRDAKHRYRCQIRHQITNHRQYSQSWAHILFKKTNDFYNSGPRLNPQLQSRHTIAIDEGESAFFYCSFDGYPTPMVEWYHTDLKTLSTFGPESIAQSTYTIGYEPYVAHSSSNNNVNGDHNEPVQISKQISNLANGQYIYGRNFLVIEKVSIEDTGIISCVANNSNSIIRHEMFLFVKSFLQVSLHTTSSIPFPGQDVTLSCNLTAVSSLFSNVQSSAFSSSNIFATEQNSNQNNHHFHDQQRQQEKRFRELISSHFMLNINWYHNGQMINYDHRKRRSAEELLLIRDFRGPEDNGVYQCSIRLTAPDYDDESFMAAIHINSIEKPPEFVDIFTDQIKQIDGPKRDFLSLKCSAYGIPVPKISWFLDGIEIYSNGHVRIETFTESYNGMAHSQSSSSSSTSSSASSSVASRSMLSVSYLNISSLHSNDVGIYECNADNYLATISHRARINQMGSPFIKPLSNQTAVLGKPYTINCTYGGYPLEEVYFVKGRIDNNNDGSGKSSSTGSLSSSSNGGLKRMPFDERHLVPMLGSITITVVEKSDQDYYRCVVVTSNGQKAEQEFYFHVAVAPVISPIVFSDNFEEGKRGSAVCTVTSGDPPIQISWFKDGIPLESIKTTSSSTHVRPTKSNHYAHHLNQIQIVPINEFMSSLIIANISRHHQGTYTCVASSPIATTSVSEFLSVKAIPQWLLKPVDQNSVSGESLTLDCQTSGQPPPVIRWKFLKNEPYRNEPIPILSSQQIHVLENGSLFLRALEPKHSGIYICDASNEVSKHPIESRAYVTVSSLPKVSIQNTLGNAAASLPNLISKGSNSLYRGFTMDRLVLRKGSQTQLMCSVIGLEQPMVAEWLRPNGETSDEWNEKSKTKTYLDSSRIVLREESKMNEKRAYLYISHVGRMDTGIYCCMGINTNGFTVSFIELLVQEPPDMPVNFRAQEINSRSITLNWSISFGGNSPITSYVVEYRPTTTFDNANTNHNHNHNNDNNNNNNIKNNKNGQQPDSNDIETKILTAKSLTTTITINALNPLTTYEFRVCAINELGASPFSDPLIITTEMEAPSLIPLDLRTLVLGSRSIKLIWSIVLSTEPSIEQIDGFYIGYRPVVSSSSTSNSVTSNNVVQSSGSIIDPSTGIMMMIGVNAAVDGSVGVGRGTMMDQSNNSGDQSTNNKNNKPVIISNNGAVNSNLNNGKVIPYTFKTMYEDHSKFVSSSMFSMAINNNGSQSVLQRSNNNMTTFCEIIHTSSESDKKSNKFYSSKQQQWSTMTTHQKPKFSGSKSRNEQIRCVYEFVVNNLQRKTRYGFIIQAFNSKGTGPVSAEVYAQTLLKDPPGKPSIKLTNVSLYEASFIWSLSHINHENEIGNEILNDFDMEQNSINIEGYIISYRALIKRVTTFSSSSLDESFDQAEFIHSDSIDDDSDEQQLFGRKYQAHNWETISVSEKILGYTLRNLRCGTLYQVRVEAFNEMGSGEPSDVLQFSTLGQAPAVPNSNAFIISNITSVMLDLDRWNNGLCPIINFALRYRIKDSKFLSSSSIDNDNSRNTNNNNNNWITVSSYLKPEYGAMYIIRELMPGTWYELSIIATNDAGETESRYLFATLTLDGATVEPLYASDYNRRHLGVIGGVSQTDSIFEDPMILIPATCAILVLLVIGAATIFIFITRSKEALSRTEHFCRHRENSRTDQLSLNLFAKNYSKSDLIRSYNEGGNSGNCGDPHKLTQIETLNCGQSTEMINGGPMMNMTSQYVEGPTSLTYTTSDCDPSSLPPIMDNVGTPSNRIGKLGNNSKPMVESFYSTPCIATQSNSMLNTQTQQPLQSAQLTNYCTQTLNKPKSAQISNEFHHPHHIHHNHGESVIIYDCDPNKQTSQSIQQQQQQHPYYTHSQFLNQCPLNSNDTTTTSTALQQLSKKKSDKDHIYELPKQQQQQQSNSSTKIEQNDANLVMMMMQQQQQQSSMGTINCNQTLQSPHRIRTDQTGNLRSFHQANF